MIVCLWIGREVVLRETQYIGLSERARSLVRWGETQEAYRIVGHKVFPDGTKIPVEFAVQEEVVQREEWDFASGAFGDEKIPLDKFTFPDGKVLFEYVQATPWSSGPVIFTAMRDLFGTPVDESLWTSEEMDAHL